MSTFLEWFTLYMVAYPEVQERFHAEVSSVVGGRSATLEDRPATHFAEATVLEVMRHCPHLALTIPHYTSDSATIGGLLIPKDTQVYYYSGAVHHTESIFQGLNSIEFPAVCRLFNRFSVTAGCSLVVLENVCFKSVNIQLN